MEGKTRRKVTKSKCWQGKIEGKKVFDMNVVDTRNILQLFEDRKKNLLPGWFSPPASNLSNIDRIFPHF